MRGTIPIPEPVRGVETDRAELDAVLTGLALARERWALTPPRVRAAMLEQAIVDTGAVARQWVEAACVAKGIDPESPAAGEEWQSGPALTIRYLRLQARTLRALAESGASPVRRARVRPDGITSVGVFPVDRWDALLFPGVRGEVWMQPGVTPHNLADHTASAYRTDRPEGRVALVLGAGNINSIPPMDALSKLIGEHSVVVLKMSPVNGYLSPILERAMAVFVDSGFLAIVDGGAETGRYLVEHPLVESVHITGSDKAHDAIVFGDDDQAPIRKAAGTPLLDKPITSELGNVSPVIVVPGPWSDADLAFQAESIASGMAHNAGFNCVANRLVINHAGWDQRSKLLSSIRATLSEIPTRTAYYPGAVQRWRSYVDAYGDRAERIGLRTDRRLPWTLISVDPDDPIGMCFQTECFVGLFSETTIAAPSVAEYLERAVEFANDRLWGSLGATLVVHPRSMRDRQVAAAVRRAIADLRYGTVAVNIWSAVAYAAVSTPWGAHPGHGIGDIQSGSGIVHNTLLFDRPLKSVAWAPFRQFPKPPWFATNRNSHRTLRALTDHEASPGLRSALRVIGHALRG